MGGSGFAPGRGGEADRTNSLVAPHGVRTGRGLIRPRAGWSREAVAARARIIVAVVLSGAAFAAFFEVAVWEARPVEAGRTTGARATPDLVEPATLASLLPSVEDRAPAVTALPPQSQTDEDDSPEALTRAEIQRLLADLADDGVRWNATEASWRLLYAMPDPESRRLIREEARPLLHSSDRQQRLLVTSLMMRLEVGIARRRGPMLTDPVLAARAIDWLHGAPRVGFECALSPSHDLATIFLITFARQVERELAALIQAEDEGLATHAAFIAGAAGLTRWSVEIADRLIPCLADNDRYQDAMKALQGLRGLGATIRPQLQDACLETEDAQATLCIRALMMEIDAPGSSEALDQRLLRSRNEKPVTQWRFGRD